MYELVSVGRAGHVREINLRSNKTPGRTPVLCMSACAPRGPRPTAPHTDDTHVDLIFSCLSRTLLYFIILTLPITRRERDGLDRHGYVTYTSRMSTSVARTEPDSITIYYRAEPPLKLLRGRRVAAHQRDYADEQWVACFLQDPP